MFFGIFILMTISSFLNLNLLNLAGYYSSYLFKVIFYGIFSIIILFSFLLFLFDRFKFFKDIKQKINRSERNRNIAFIVCFVITIFVFSYYCSNYIYGSTNGAIQKNKEVALLADCIVISIFIPGIIIKVLRQWIYNKGKCFSFKDDKGEVWYLIKPLNENEFITESFVWFKNKFG